MQTIVAVGVGSDKTTTTMTHVVFVVDVVKCGKATKRGAHGIIARANEGEEGRIIYR